VNSRRAAAWMVGVSYVAIVVASISVLRAPPLVANIGFAVWAVATLAAMWINWRTGLWALPTVAVLIYWIILIDGFARSCAAGDCS
jgi:hypothetical protein